MKKRNTLLFVLFVFIISISILWFSYGFDFFWHLKSGEYIAVHQKIPFTDIFSWYGVTNHLHWISHEWLFEVFIYPIFLIFGRFGIFLFVLLMISLLAFLLFKVNQEKFLKFPFYTILWAIGGMLFFANKALPRPHLFSYLFFLITLLFSYDTYKRKDSKLIYFAPLISILWSNFHGGSSNLSYIIYGVFFGVSLFSFDKKHLTNPTCSKEVKWKFLYAFLSSILGIMVNPHHVLMMFYPYQNLGYHVMIHCIEEWQMLNIFTVDGCVYICFILSLFLILLSSKKHQVIDIVLLFLFIILGIQSTKFMPYLFIASSFIIPSYWNGCRIKIDLVPIFIFLICFLSLFYLFFYKKAEFKLVSDEMISYLKKEDVILYNSYGLGGYLIFKDVPVFIDGRADMYVDTILCDSCLIETGEDFNPLDRYPFNTFLVQNNTKVENYLSENSKYTLILKDKRNSLYRLSSS